MANSKPKNAPQTTSKNTGVVSFGKLFLHFVASPLKKSLSVDELQVIFYSMNSSCGPMGQKGETHSIAEFPINLVVFRKAHEERVKSTNTDALTAEEFMQLVINSQFTDVRSIGYGRKHLYKSWDKDKPTASVEPEKGAEAAKSAQAWSDLYGDLKLPMIEMVIDPEVTSDGKKIRKIHIYDTQSTPFEEVEEAMRDSREKLKLLLERGVPVITPGSNGSLVTNSTIASKTDGTQGSIYLLRAMDKQPSGGHAQMANSGLEEEGHLPLRTLPVQVTLATFGVPIARLYQTYFIDYNTGTTLDNLYVCTQLQHNITPGKFFTNWTFAYTNGYGKFGNVTTPAAATPAQSVSQPATVVSK